MTTNTAGKLEPVPVSVYERLRYHNDKHHRKLYSYKPMGLLSTSSGTSSVIFKVSTLLSNLVKRKGCAK